MIINDIFNKRQTITSYSIKELKQMYNDGMLIVKEVQQHQVRAIKKYISENATNGQIYFPPLVANVEIGRLNKGKPTQLTIIDGTQRIKALIQLDDFINKAMKSEKSEETKIGFKLQYVLNDTELAVQIFEGLSEEEANQLYIDLNTKGKKVSLSKRIAYDSRNEINQITNLVLQSNQQLKIAGVEMEKRAVIRPSNQKLLSLSQLRQLVGIFLTGKTFYNTTEINEKLPLKIDEYVEMIDCWFDELFQLYPAKTIGNYHHSMLASFPLLESIVVYANKGLESLPIKRRKKNMIDRMRDLQNINWERTNKKWKQFSGSKKGKNQYFYLDNSKENIKEIVKWLQNQGR